MYLKRSAVQPLHKGVTRIGAAGARDVRRYRNLGVMRAESEQCQGRDS